MEQAGHEGCTIHAVAHSAVGHVAACAHCGNIHLTLEFLTLRLQPAAFRELASMIGVARARLDPPAREAASPAAPDAMAASSSVH